MKTWSPQRERALFVHIPKTGGMTLRGALRSQYADEDVSPAEDWPGLRELPKAMDAYKLYVGHFRYFARRLLPDDTKVFTFLRDPVSRTISHLKHLASDPAFSDLHDLAKGRDLRAIAEDRRIMRQCCNVQVGYLSGARPGMTDADLAKLPDENECVYSPDTIDNALAALQAMAFVGFVDDLDTDFARLCEILHLHPPTQLPHINTAKARAPMSSKDAELREIVAQADTLDCTFYAAAKALYGTGAPLAPRADRLADLIQRGACPIIDTDMTFPMSGPVPGTGLWWPNGNWAQGFFRWTGPENTLCLELPLAPDQAFSLQMRVAQRIDVGEITAFVDDVPVELRREQINDVASYLQFEIPASRTSPIATVKIVAERMHRASESDPRMLGFVLSEVQLTLA